MFIVSNATPIISFLKIKRVDILRSIFKEIIIPQAVYNEITAKNELNEEIEDFKKCNFIKIENIRNEFAVNLIQKQLGLDLGESEAIVLAEDLKARYLLIDERKGRRVAEESGIKIIGTVGIIVRAKNMKIVDKVKPLLDNLIEKNIRISSQLYTSILELVGEA